MYNIPLNNTFANQEFDILFPDINIDNLHILLQTTDNGALFLSVFQQGKQLGQPFICCPNQLIIPFPSIQNKIGGNFVFETTQNQYPIFENFGVSCFLNFYLNEEL